MRALYPLWARPPGRGKKPRNPHGYSLWGGLLLAVFALLVPGCATKPTLVTQEVKIPVAVPCIAAAPARPAFQAPTLPASASEGEKVLALARDTLLHFKYEGQLEAAIAGCL